MSPRTTITGTALVLVALGVPALFIPDVVLGDAATDPASVAVQLFGGALLAVAALDWTGRSAIYGGIYGRPIVVANFALGVMTAGTAISATLDGRLPPRGWAVVVVFALIAIAFFRLMRRPPWETHPTEGGEA